MWNKESQSLTNVLLYRGVFGAHMTLQSWLANWKLWPLNVSPPSHNCRDFPHRRAQFDGDFYEENPEAWFRCLTTCGWYAQVEVEELPLSFGLSGEIVGGEMSFCKFCGCFGHVSDRRCWRFEDPSACPKVFSKTKMKMRVPLKAKKSGRIAYFQHEIHDLSDRFFWHELFFSLWRCLIRTGISDFEILSDAKWNQTYISCATNGVFEGYCGIVLGSWCDKVIPVQSNEARNLNFVSWKMLYVCVYLPSLKVTSPLENGAWKTTFLLGRPIFRGVSFRECNLACFVEKHAPVN